jgi:hypothetical protein
MVTTKRTWWFRTGTLGMLAAAGAGFLIGQATTNNRVYAAPPAKPAAPPAVETNSRYVAHLYNGSVPITREDLGEYLIARHGKDSIDLLVNKTIIDHACAQKGITVTDAEVEAALLEDLKGINVNRKQFVDSVLKQYGKTLYEWKEDVLRPRIQLSKLCKLQITVTEEEIKQAFDAEFGPRVEGRIIIWPKGQEKFAYQSYDEIRSSDDKFDEAARQQAVSHLAASGGRIKPFGRGAGTHPELEKEAFKLKPGQVSTVIGTNEGTVVFKCDRHLPPDEGAKLDDHRERLSRIVYDKKLAQEIPKQFKALRDAANPVIFIKKDVSPEDIERTTQQLLQTGATQPKK